MRTAVIGRGLIGGSIEKAAKRAGFDADIFRGRGPVPDLSGYDIVFVATPPSAIPPIVKAIAESGTLDDGATVVDIAGVKGTICRELGVFAKERRWRFVGGHPMAGKEKLGYANSCAGLFDGASMILTPFPEELADPDFTGEVLPRLERYFKALGFSRVVVTDPKHHDEMIAFTSQLCHLMSSAYVRESLSAGHAGYSAGSFRDMVRVGAPDPDTWSELFLANAAALVPVLERYIARLADFRDAIASGDSRRLHNALTEGVAAKDRIDGESASGSRTTGGTSETERIPK